MKSASCVGILILAAWLALPGARAAENLYPDPGFEKTGVPGAAHTGERAGYLKSSAQERWVALGEGRLPVQPFATYRATAWAKAKVGAGQALALYCYGWNSFDWAFARNAPLGTSDEWQRVEVTFVSPDDTMTVHPLAFNDAGDGEAWVDDVVVEKVAEPEETMAPLLAKPDPSKEEIQLLVRYHVSRGEGEKAQALLAKAPDAYTKADIACVLAIHTRDPRERRRWAVEMLRNGGPSYASGMQRFSEVTEGMAPAEKLAVCREALEADPASLPAAQGFRRLVAELVAPGSTPGTCAEMAARLQPVAGAVAALQAAAPAGSPARAELEAAAKDTQAAQAALAARRGSLGHCRILIGKMQLGPESYAIVIPARATPQEEFAARDLQAHLELLTGAVIPLAKDGELGARMPIVIGKCDELRKLGVKVDFAALGTDGIAIKTVGPALVLAGNKRGVLYACYTFLEDYLGCRWFAPDCSTTPREGTFRIGKIDRTYVPALEYRATDYPNSREANWAVRSKINGVQAYLDEQRGGKISYRGFVHTFNELVPPSRYFAQHPDYFSEIKGKRVGPEYTQLCLTNPEVLRIAIESVRRWIKESPEATIFSVSQNDWHNYCECANCKALAEKEGSQSGPLLHFVNAIADAIKDEHPGKIIDTLAYQYTRKPPKLVRPRPNVAVRLCSIECCFAHPLASDPFNKTFVADIRGWAKICKRLHIWDYVIDYSHSIMPFPNLYVLKPNIEFFIRNSVTGIYEEADYFTKGGELAELRTYIMAKTLWDPRYDTRKAIEEFCAAYYGAAAGPIRQYLDLIHQSVRRHPKFHMPIWTQPTADYLTPEVLRRAEALFDRAERAAAGDAIRLHRVKVARLPVIYTQIAHQKLTFREQGDSLVAAAGQELAGLIERFTETARAEGVTKVSEGTDLDAWLSRLPKANAPLRIVRLRSPALELSLLPDRGGRIWRMRYLPNGKDLIKRYGSEEGYEPTEGGYEEYSGSGYRSPGWSEVYKVIEQTERSATLEASLPNGLKMVRRIELDARKPEVRITSSVTNEGKAPAAACVRVHPTFLIPDTQKATVWCRKPDGAWEKHPLAHEKEPLGEHELWLRGELHPAGEWAVVDDADDVGILDRFEAGGIATCYVNWEGGEQRANLELFGPEVQLAPGKTLSVAHTYTVLSPASAGLGR